MQVIPNESNAQIPVYGIFMPPGTAKFMILSKRFIYYDTFKKGDFIEAMDKQKQNELAPFHCELNKYYLTFTVVTN